jgi:hypothetical protein
MQFRHRHLRLLLRKAFFSTLLLASTAWGALAITICAQLEQTARVAVATSFAFAGLLAIIALLRDGWRSRTLALYAILFGVTLIWWFNLAPSNERDWQADVAILPYATIAGDMINMHNIRNADYRSETDYSLAYYDQRFDLSKLQGVDIVSSYWMGPAIAHVFLSFEFEGGQHLAISIETRKEKSEAYSTIKGFFRQYELYYLVADERDVIRVRSNYRADPPEDVYVYRLQGSLDDGRRVLLEYLRHINNLKKTPLFYNSLTSNCTTSIWLNAQVNPDTVPMSWKILASGYLPEYLYEQGKLKADGLTFSQLQQQSHINARARAADNSPGFSRLIRLPLPASGADARTDFKITPASATPLP